MLFIAGGHATYLHADHIHKMIPSDIPLHGFADAGYAVMMSSPVVISANTGTSLMPLMSMEIMYRENSFKQVSKTFTH